MLLYMTTQLEKDVASNAGVIPIWPWLDEDGKTKDGLPTNIYANMLLQEKRANGQDGAIIRCHHDGCENDYKSIFWRSADTPENIVPKGWIDFGPPHHFTECPSCRARDIQDIGLQEPQEYERVDINLKHGSTGSTGASDKQLRSSRYGDASSSRPIIPIIKNTTRRTNMKLKEQARKLFKNHPEHLKAALQQIDDDERKKRANAAQDRKRKKDDKEYYEKRRRTGGRRKKRRKTRRKKRRKTRRKKRRKTRRKKKHRKKRTRRRRK